MTDREILTVAVGREFKFELFVCVVYIHFLILLILMCFIESSIWSHVFKFKTLLINYLCVLLFHIISTVSAVKVMEEQVPLFKHDAKLCDSLKFSLHSIHSRQS